MCRDDLRLAGLSAAATSSTVIDITKRPSYCSLSLPHPTPRFRLQTHNFSHDPPIPSPVSTTCIVPTACASLARPRRRRFRAPRPRRLRPRPGASLARPTLVRASVLLPFLAIARSAASFVSFPWLWVERVSLGYGCFVRPDDSTCICPARTCADNNLSNWRIAS